MNMKPTHTPNEEPSMSSDQVTPDLNEPMPEHPNSPRPSSETMPETAADTAAEAATEAAADMSAVEAEQQVMETTPPDPDGKMSENGTEDGYLHLHEETDAEALLDAIEEAGDDYVEALKEQYEEYEEEASEEADEETVTEQRAHEMENKFQDLIAMLDDRHYADFRRELDELNPVDAADFFCELPPKRIPAVFKLLAKDSAADVFAELDVDVQERIITAMTDRELSAIIEDLALDDAVDMLEELPANIVRRIMKNATPETRVDINRLLAYPEDSAGSIMTAEFIDLRAEMTCAEAIAHIRRTGIDKETVYVAYVTDARRMLEGIVPLKELLFASPDRLIRDIMDPDVICASTMDEPEAVAQTISKYDLLALPIVDREGRLVGIVTVDDAMDVMQAEVTEDLEKMAAISPTDKPYLKTGVWETWKKRIPWLLLLMLSATFTSVILTKFESILNAATISLSVFVPMLTDTGGNASSQTSVTIIRGLSLGEIEMRDVLRVLWKEVRVATLCGVTVAAACFVKTMLVDFGLKFTAENVWVAIIICITMFSAVMLAKIIGVLLPIGAKRLGFDPAVMASPFITTIVDTLTLLIFVGTASLVLHI